MVLDIGQVESLLQCRVRQSGMWHGINTAVELLTISDFGATDQFSLHRFARPLTTSALLPINRNKPMTFLRQVPILKIARSMSVYEGRA